MELDDFNFKNSSELVEIEDIGGTPFKLITKQLEKKGTKSFIGYGQHRLTNDKPSKEEALQDLQDNMINIIMTAAGVMTDKIVDIKLQEEYNLMKKEEFRAITKKPSPEQIKTGL